MIAVSYFENLIGEYVLVIKQDESTDFIRLSQIRKLEITEEKSTITVVNSQNNTVIYEYSELYGAKSDLRTILVQTNFAMELH